MEFSVSRSSFITHSLNNIEEIYTIESKLGEGACGSVYLCKNKITSEMRAIKYIQKSKIRYPDRLKNEVSTLISCDHPNIIKIFEIFENKEYLYIVMELCNGGELFDYIVKNKKIQEAEAAMLFRQVILAINYLHNHHIVHRDIKPENLTFSDNKILKLIDFGIAKRVNPNETMTTRAGTVIDI